MDGAANPAPNAANGERHKLGLSLAGGGFRASLFHLGVLRRMAELDLLRYVEVLSTVSGGSIIGALYVLILRRAINRKGTLTQAEYAAIIDELHKVLVAGIQKNLRTRLLMNPLGVLRVLVTHDSLGKRMARIYERYIYRHVLPRPTGRALWRWLWRPGTIRLQDVRFTPGGRELTEGLEAYNRSAVAGKGSAVTSLILNATSLNSGVPFRFSSVEIGDSRLGAFRTDEIDSELLPRKSLLETVPFAGLAAALAAPSAAAGTVTIQGTSYPRPMALYACWWRAVQGEGPLPAGLPGIFGAEGPPASLRDGDYSSLRQAKLSAWYLGPGRQRTPPVSAAVSDTVLKMRLWEALRTVDETLARRLEAQVGGDPSLWPELLDVILHIYYLRSARAVSWRIVKDWSKLTLGDAVGASACFPPVFPPFILLGIYDDLKVTRLGLSDGGVYDNLGVTALLEQGCNYIIASDTGGLFDVDQRSSTGRVGMGGRIISILMDDVAEQQRATLRRQRRISQAVLGSQAPALTALESLYGLDGLAYFHINSPRPDVQGLKLGFDARALANIRTDLDAFGDVEVAALVNHGYDIADRYIRQTFFLSPYMPTPAWSAPTAAPVPLAVDERTRRILRIGKSRFLRAVMLWAPLSVLFTVAVLGALIWATWAMPVDEVISRAVKGAAGLVHDGMFGAVLGWTLSVCRRYAVSLGAVILAALAIVGLARWGWRPFIDDCRKRSPRATRNVLWVAKWLRSLAKNVFWIVGGGPIWLSLAASLLACVSHIFYAKPFLRVTKT